ncbi:MAG: hypothetical protein V2A62_00510 [Candidatus Woesearchaeota archaeon]
MANRNSGSGLDLAVEPGTSTGNKYVGVSRIVLIVEDEQDKRSSLDTIAQAAFGEDRAAGISVVASTNQAIEELKQYQQGSPTATLRALLDYNMGHNLRESKRPTYGLWFDETFQHFLRNGGYIVFNSGYIADIYQSPELMDTQKTYPNVALFLAEKSDATVTPLKIVERILKQPDDHIPAARSIAERCGYDLSKLFKQMK